MPLTDDAAPLTTVDEHALLNEFKMAAQSLIEVWSELRRYISTMCRYTRKEPRQCFVIQSVR